MNKNFAKNLKSKLVYKQVFTSPYFVKSFRVRHYQINKMVIISVIDGDGAYGCDKFPYEIATFYAGEFVSVINTHCTWKDVKRIIKEYEDGVRSVRNKKLYQ